MGRSRLVNPKAMPACLTLLTVLMVMSSSGSAQPAPKAPRQQAVCSLKLQGAPQPETPKFTVASAELDCISTSPVSIGVNSTYLGKHMSQFTGVQIISDLACQQQAQGWWKSSGGTKKSLLAMLYFCGDYDITLLQPKVLNMTLKQNSSDWFSAILAFGDSTTATVRQGRFVGNSAGSTIVAFQTATLLVEDHSVFDHNSGWVGTGVKATDEASLVVRDAVFSYNTATWNGGALGCYWNASVSIDSCLFHNNAANRTGGAVDIFCISGQQATVTNTTFKGNSADFGGAADLHVNTNISIRNSSFTANHASTSGGGIYLDTSSAITATGCTFDMNNASYGGGVYCDGCLVQAGRLSFTHNNAVKWGGGLDVINQAQINITNSTWRDNTADKGAGIAFGATDAESLSSPAAATLNISESTFNNNTAATSGGACDLEGFVEATVTNTTFKGNSADYGGAADLHVNTTISIENSSFTANHASTSGGGIYLDTNSSVTATGCTFDVNNASYGGGLYCDGCMVQAQWLSFIRNNAVTSGGGLYASIPAQANVSNTTFQGNSADYGGAAYLYLNTTISMELSSFTANHASTSGGSIYLNTDSSFTTTGCTFDKSNAIYGGGLYCNGCSVQAARLSFTHNNAVKWGGGLFATDQAQVVILDSNISGCAADLGGAVALTDQATLHVSGSRFWNNTADSNGAVIDAEGQTRIFVKNSTFVGNHAGMTGAVLMTQSAQMFVSHNCSFINNSAPLGGAISVGISAKLTLSNSSLLNNSAESGGALALTEASVALVTAGSIISGNNAGIQTATENRGGGVYAADHSLVTINGDSKVQGNAAGFGGGVHATGAAQVIMEGSSVSGNQAVTEGGGLCIQTNASGNLTGCKVASNVAGLVGGGLASLDQTVLTLKDCLVTNNSASDNGGGIVLTQTAKLMLLGNTSVTSNHATSGWGGGVSLISSGFDLDQVSRAVHNNSGQYDVNVESRVTHLSVVGNTSIFDFANQLGKGDGLLPVILNVSGYHGLPCQYVRVQAVLQGTFLGLNHSDEHGLVNLGLRIARPPGVYVISLSSSDAPGLLAANLTLHVRSCIRGEVTPSPVACQPCQQGFFSFDPSQKVCSACPGNAKCSGGDVITPLPGYWRSSIDSVQIHRCPNPTACNPAGDSALLACAATLMCGTSTTYKDLQCAAGYYGNVCGLCLPGTGATRLFVCRGCMRSGYIIALYLTAAVILLCLIKLMCHLNCNQDKTANHADDQQSMVPAAQLLRPLLLYSQYMLVVSSMPIEWPASIGYPLKVLAWVWSPASPETLSIDCLLPRGTHLPISIQKLLFYVCTPLVILGLLLLVEMAQVQYLRVRKKHVAMQVKDLLHSSALVAVFFFYPSILRNLFSMFACIPLDQPAAAPYTPAAVGSYWVMDMNQQCFTGYHRAWALGFGLPCVLLVCLGLPLGTLVLMLNKRAYLAEATTRQHYGFLYMSYRQPMFCWECVVMTQTMVLVAISVFGVNLGVIYQVIVMNAALILMWTLLLIFKPYAYHQAGKVMLQAVFCLLLTSYTALTFLQWGVIQPSPEYGLIMGCVVLLVNLVYVVSVVWQMIRLVKWKKVWNTVELICSKLKCSHSRISGLAGIGVRHGSKQQALVAMALFPEQHANLAPTGTV